MARTDLRPALIGQIGGKKWRQLVILFKCNFVDLLHKYDDHDSIVMRSQLSKQRTQSGKASRLFNILLVIIVIELLCQLCCTCRPIFLLHWWRCSHLSLLTWFIKFTRNHKFPSNKCDRNLGYGYWEIQIKSPVSGSTDVVASSKEGSVPLSAKWFMFFFIIINTIKVEISSIW